MTWPVVPLPTAARAILLLPAGFRAFDDDFLVAFPPPATIECDADRYELLHIHHAGRVDQETRALYFLRGTYLPHGGVLRLDPDEACDQ